MVTVIALLLIVVLVLLVLRKRMAAKVLNCDVVHNVELSMVPNPMYHRASHSSMERFSGTPTMPNSRERVLDNFRPKIYETVADARRAGSHLARDAILPRQIAQILDGKYSIGPRVSGGMDNSAVFHLIFNPTFQTYTSDLIKSVIDDKNTLGTGATARVYKSQLLDEGEVAIKVFITDVDLDTVKNEIVSC